MISEGHEIPGPTPLTDQLKVTAREVLAEGPPALSNEEIQDRRYQISELIDDIREPRSKAELTASATVVYSELADYYFRTKREWTGSGKAILKRLRQQDPALARRFADAFEFLFTSGQSQKVIDLASEILAPQGGFLFEGYRRDSPLEWRMS